MSRIPVHTSGFTPVFDAVTDEVGYRCAVVHGAVWRLGVLQGNGRCAVSTSAIGEVVGYSSRQTVQKHLDILVERGFIIDLTPDAEGVAHTYTDAGRVTVKGEFAAGGNGDL